MDRHGHIDRHFYVGKATLPTVALCAGLLGLFGLGAFCIVCPSQTFEYAFSISPDGQHVASIQEWSRDVRLRGPEPLTLRYTLSIVVRHLDGPKVCRARIAGGRGRNPIGSDISIAWDPSGQRLAYRCGATLGVFDVASSNSRVLATTVDAFRWQDKNRLIYTTGHGTAARIEIPPGDTAPAAPCLPSAGPFAWPHSNPISPDGRQFVCRGGLAVKAVDAGNAGIAHSLPGRFEPEACWWSPDSQRCLLQATDVAALGMGTWDTETVFLYDRRDGAFTPVLLPEDKMQFSVKPTSIFGWSPLSTWFVAGGCTRRQGQTSLGAPRRMNWVFLTDLSQAVTIEESGGNVVWDVRVSPAKSQLAFLSSAAEYIYPADLCIAEVLMRDGNVVLEIVSRRRLAHRGHWLWSHDGESILVFNGQRFSAYPATK